MFSTKTLLELVRIADKLSQAEIDRIITVFNFPHIPQGFNPSKTEKTNEILSYIRYHPNKEGPFTKNIQLDFLQYIIDEFFDHRPRFERGDVEYHSTEGSVKFENAFSAYNQQLRNSLKRDGYIIVGREIKKLLPQEIEEAKVESELMLALDKFGFTLSKGHLNHAIANHSQGRWAGANSQFRTFIESLLIEINNHLLPQNTALTAAQAIKLLSETINPPFLKADLNEVPLKKGENSFVYGLWVRLHPEGSHPGLSDEEDCSFRYQIAVVFSNYLLRRLENL